MLKKVIYISSDNRSGSSLLDALLGNHSDITGLGEVHNLGAFVDGNGNRIPFYPSYPLLCACGKTFADCPFWQSIEKRLCRPLSELKLRLRNKNLPFVLNALDSIKNRGVYFAKDRFPVVFDYPFVLTALGYKDVADHFFDLYETVSGVRHTAFVVDSSKDPHYLSFLNAFYPSKLKVLLLYRNPKAVAYSRLKRGRSLEEACTKWVQRALEMKFYTRLIPAENLLVLKYEDLCGKIETTMHRICDFLGIPYEPNLTEFHLGNHHFIGGSPSLRTGKITSIRLDDTYKSRLTESQVRYIDSRTKKVAASLGY